MKQIFSIIEDNLIKRAYDTYSFIRSKMRHMEPFAGSSAKAEWQVEDGKDIYMVSSYNTVIVKVDKEGKILFYDSKRYSPTTSKIQEIIRVVFPKTHPTLFTQTED